MDSVELERTVAGLNKELMASRQAEEALRAELASFQAPDQGDVSMKQVRAFKTNLIASAFVSIQLGVKH